ncbi:MAG TPA: addiction module protein [Chitinophagales bacterium]|nr:addiction module protein [Chitinophagales bacterium]
MSVIEEILKLPKADRIELVKTIWDSIDDESEDFPLTQDQLTELRRRRAAYDEGNMPVYSWEEVKNSIQKKRG